MSCDVSKAAVAVEVKGLVVGKHVAACGALSRVLAVSHVGLEDQMCFLQACRRRPVRCRGRSGVVCGVC